MNKEKQLSPDLTKSFILDLESLLTKYNVKYIEGDPKSRRLTFFVEVNNNKSAFTAKSDHIHFNFK